MNSELLEALNRIMADAARDIRTKHREHPEMDLTPLWVKTLETLSSEVAGLQLMYTPDTDPEMLKRKYRGRPWSFERFVAYTTKQPPV